MKYFQFSILVLIAISIAACKKEGDGWTSINAYTESLKTGPGPEDIAADNFNGRKRILASCDQRRDGAEPYAEIVAIDLKSNDIFKMSRVNEPSALPFRPHGIYIIEIDGKPLLYVINHYRDQQNTNSVLVYQIGERELIFVKEYRHEWMISPNDLCVLPGGGFYFSNDKGPGELITENLFNKYGGSLVYCTSEGECKPADEKLAFPNGLEYRDGYLYLATTRHQALFRYEVQADGSLLNRTKISNINGMDNLIWYGEELLVSVHPDEIAFVVHSLQPKVKSPSEVYAIHATTGKSRMLFKDDGKRISGGSTAMIVDNYLYIAQVFEDFVLKVSLTD
jgi:hypothetical protein